MHACNRESTSGAISDAGFCGEGSGGQVRGRCAEERRRRRCRCRGAVDGGIEASLERIVSHLLDHCRWDLHRLRGVPDTQIVRRTADFRGVAFTGDIAFTVFGVTDFLLDGGEGLQAVAAVACVAVLDTRETVVVLRAVGLAGT